MLLWGGKDDIVRVDIVYVSMPELYYGESMKKIIMFLILLIQSFCWGDWCKGLVCNVYGDLIGYYLKIIAHLNIK